MPLFSASESDLGTQPPAPSPRAQGSPERHLIVSLHDVHPGSQSQIEEQIHFLAERGVPRCSLLVVPHFHHEGNVESHGRFQEAVSRWQSAGHEIVLHGYFHDRLESPRESWKTIFWTRFYTNQEAEFLDLPLLEARRRIEKGRKLFQRLGWNPQGFVAPAWLMAEGLTNLLADMGFVYTNRLKELIPLRPGAINRVVHSQSLCYSCRAAWRRVASGIWNKHLFSRLRPSPLIRLSLHPRDLDFPLPRRQIDQIVRASIKDKFTPTTYLDYVTR